MSKRDRHVRKLMRRRDYLIAQVAVAESRGQDTGPIHHVRAEHAALEFALAALEDAEAIGLPQLGSLSLAERAHLKSVVEKAAVAV